MCGRSSVRMPSPGSRTLTSTPLLRVLRAHLHLTAGRGVPQGVAGRVVEHAPDALGCIRQFPQRARLVNLVSGLLLLTVDFYDPASNWESIRTFF